MLARVIEFRGNFPSNFSNPAQGDSCPHRVGRPAIVTSRDACGLSSCLSCKQRLIATGKATLSRSSARENQQRREEREREELPSGEAEACMKVSQARRR